MKRIYNSLCLCIVVFSSLLSQDKVEIRLIQTNYGASQDITCFDTQIKNISNNELNLADQNYRIFYDALQLKSIDQKIQCLLPKQTYAEVDLNQSLHNIDARGYGDLKFDQNLGFLNYSIRMNDDHGKITALSPHSSWISTTNICFKTTDPQGPINIVWARKGLTQGYATAYTEISSIKQSTLSHPVEIQVFQDYIRLSDGTEVNNSSILQAAQNH